MNSHQNNESDPTNTGHTTGNPNVDPSPTGDPDLDEGGGVTPGATPPESNSATASPPHLPDRRPPRSRWAIVGIGAVLLVIIVVFVAYAVGMFA